MSVVNKETPRQKGHKESCREVPVTYTPRTATYALPIKIAKTMLFCGRKWQPDTTRKRGMTSVSLKHNNLSQNGSCPKISRMFPTNLI